MWLVIWCCLLGLTFAQYYDPTTRDYTEICIDFAEIAQEKYCQVSDSECFLR
ncbi:unnamed protein product [Anisakis simplex]|uniref:Venom protein n=1 Tax=Anisakis simplex TaxID=6269 RepID=A0A0M3JQH2_ANISI|nr:unnamed protein product [Anisakis simplex]VDK41081.1 unnamed protein product [Anisakis simplex]